MNFVFLLVIFISLLSQNFLLVFWLAFAAGLGLDLWLGNFLGLSSLAFLFVSFLVYLYRRRFSSSHLLFQLGFILLAQTAFVLWTKEIWSWFGFLGLALISLSLLLLTRRIFDLTASGLKLEVLK